MENIDTKGFRNTEFAIVHGASGGFDSKKFIVLEGDSVDDMKPASASDLEYELISETETKVKYNGSKRYVSVKT